MVSVFPNRLKRRALEAYASGKTFRACLVRNTYTPNADHNVWSQVSANEAVDTGGSPSYAAGGQVLTGVGVTQDDTNDRGVLTFDAPSWDPVTMTGVRYLVVIAGTGGTIADYEICGTYDFGSDQSVTNGPLEWTPNAAGALYIG